MGVWPARGADLDAVTRLLEGARDWQRGRGVGVWSPFDRDELARDIAEGCVHVAKEHGLIGGAVTLLESEPLLWEDDAAALYLHRLVSARRGAGALLIRWSRVVAQWRGKRCVRLETWSENATLRAYYERQGFRHVKDRAFPADSPAPADYRGTTKSFYQLDV